MIPMLFVIFIFYNLAFYSVKIFDDKTIQFGFPQWHIKLQSHEIKSIEETVPYQPIKDFGGLGWRIGKKDGSGNAAILYGFRKELKLKQ